MKKNILNTVIVTLFLVLGLIIFNKDILAACSTYSDLGKKECVNIVDNGQSRSYRTCILKSGNTVIWGSTTNCPSGQSCYNGTCSSCGHPNYCLACSGWNCASQGCLYRDSDGACLDNDGDSLAVQRCSGYSGVHKCVNYYSYRCTYGSPQWTNGSPTYCGSQLCDTSTGYCPTGTSNECTSGSDCSSGCCSGGSCVAASNCSPTVCPSVDCGASSSCKAKGGNAFCGNPSMSGASVVQTGLCPGSSSCVCIRCPAAGSCPTTCHGATTVANGCCGTTSCSATPAVNGSCGSGKNTCITGTVGSMTSQVSGGVTIYNWTCNGNCTGTSTNCTTQECATINPTAGICGASEGTCALGYSSGVSTIDTASGQTYYWTCTGSDGTCPSVSATPTSCSVVKCTKVNGVNGACGSTAAYQCISGTVANISENEVNYIWDCAGTAGSCTGSNGTNATGCYYPKDQEAWFQSQNGGVFAKGSVINWVPASCTANNCATSYTANGIVAGLGSINKSNYDRSNNFLNKNLVPNSYNYNYFYREYFVNRGIGLTITGNKDWTTDFGNSIGNTGVVLVNGDININNNMTGTGFIMLVASGNINISQSVTSVRGILVGNNIIASGSGNQLIINGLIYGASGIRLNRSYSPKSGNNTSPAVLVNYDSSLIFNLPKEVNKKIVKWSVD